MTDSMTAPIAVLVTRQEYNKGRATFERVGRDIRCTPVEPDEASLARAVREQGVSTVIVGVEPYRAALYEALPAGGIIARFGVGYDSIDLVQATAHRLVVANTPGVLDTSVAEHAIWLLGALAKPIIPTDVALKAGHWQPTAGRELAGQTLAVIGYGRIGRRVAAIAGLGLDMRVIGFDCLPLETMLKVANVDSERELQRTYGTAVYTTDPTIALRQADFVSVHLAVTAETRGYLNAERLAWIKPGACLVNTARGALVDENALYDALASGRLGGAALDVFQNEPYKPVDPQRDLRTLPNVVLTPHIGSSTTAANRRMAERSIANVRSILGGRWAEASIVNEDVLMRLDTR